MLYVFLLSCICWLSWVWEYQECTRRVRLGGPYTVGLGGDVGHMPWKCDGVSIVRLVIWRVFLVLLWRKHRLCGLQSPWTSLPHTYSVSQPLPPYPYSWRNRHPKTTRLYSYTTGLHTFYDFNLRLGIRKPPTHILSHNYYHHMCIREGIHTQNHSNLRLYVRTSPLLCFCVCFIVTQT